MSHLFNSIKNLAGSYIQKDSNESTGESSREMRFNLSPPSGALKVRGDAGRPIITDETNSSSDFNQWLHAMKMVARLPGGMPPEFRRKLWLALAEKYLKSKNVDWEKEEVKCFSEQWREDDEELGIQIVKDLHRTGSSLCSGPAGTINQAKLKRILLGYARYNPEVGYCQGFNMLGALILQVMDKEEIESIKVMIYLVEGILPRGYFSGSLGGLQADMAVFRELMTCKLPRLAKHLQKLQGPVENAFEPPLTNVFTMQWFLTMFCTCLPMTCVLRVWDLVLIEGSDVLLRTALVLWSLLEERILKARTADDFYCKMGSFSSELLNGHLIDSNGLIEKVVDLGPIAELQKLRDKHLYNISPFRDKKGLQLYYSDEEGDSDEDSRMAVATAWGLRLSRRGSAGLSNKTDSKDRIALDISLLKKQYDRLRERQRQAHIILTSAVARQGSNSNQSSIQMNQLLIGRNAIVTNNGRRLGPPQGAIPPARKPSLPTAKSPKPTQTKTLRRGETLHWRDTELSKRRRGSLKWKDIKSDSSQSGQDERTSQLIESAPSSRSSSSEPKSQRASLKTHQRSDSSSYSEDSDGNSSTSTSLCDEDDHEIGNVSSLEGSPMKKTKKKHSEVHNKKCLEDVLNSNEKPHTVDSQIPFIQLTTMDSPVLNANKTDIDSLEYAKEDSETESNRLDYAGFVDEYSWPDMNEATNSTALEDITIDVTSDEGDFLSLSNVITSTSQLSPLPDITTYINNSNISPLRTPISAFDYANLVVSIDDSKRFDVNDEGVTNEYFERVNIVERPTKLDLLYSLNEEDSIRNAYKMASCQSSPEVAAHGDNSEKQSPSPESSKFLIYDNSTKILPSSTDEMDRKMKVLLEYSNQSSLSFIAEAKHEISSGIYKEKEFDPKSLKYQPSALIPSNNASANIKPTRDETIEHVFVIPPVEKTVKIDSSELSKSAKKDTIKGYDLESPVKIHELSDLEVKSVVFHDSDSKPRCTRYTDDIPLIAESSASTPSVIDGNSKMLAKDEFKNDFELNFAKQSLGDVHSYEYPVPKVEQEDVISVKNLTQKTGEAKLSPSEKIVSDLNSNRHEKLEVLENDGNLFRTDAFIANAVCQIPSTEDLESRFKALEMTFTDRKGPSSRTKDGENENKHASNFSENKTVTTKDTSNLETSESNKKQAAKRLDLTNTTALEPEPSAKIKLPEGTITPFLPADIVTPSTVTIVKEQPLETTYDSSTLFEGKNEDHRPLSYTQYQSAVEQASRSDKPFCIKNKAPFADEIKEEHSLTTISKKQATETTTLKKLNQKQSSDIDGLEYSIGQDRTNEYSLVKDSSLNTSVAKQKSGLKKDMSKVDDQLDSQSNSDSVEKDIVEAPDLKESRGLEKCSLLTKDVSEVDQSSLNKIDSESKIDATDLDQSKDISSISDDSLPTRPLSFTQDYFGDKLTSQSKFKIPNVSKRPFAFDEQTNIDSGFETLPKNGKTQEFLEEIEQFSEDSSINRPILDNLSAEEQQLNAIALTKSTKDKEQFTSNPAYDEESSPALLSYSEDHFNKSQPSQVTQEKLDKQLEKEKPDLLYPAVEQLLTFIEDRDKKPCLAETPTHEFHCTTDRMKDNIMVIDAVNIIQSKKSTIPSTKDLESRFMALERQLSEKPVPDIFDQSNAKDKMAKKDSIKEDIFPDKLKGADQKIHDIPITTASLDKQVELATTDETRSINTKPIPSTADLEHRFRELERKLSSTSIKSSFTTTAPQEDHLKALTQSNILTNPSIVLPNNEDIMTSNTPSSTTITSKSNGDRVAKDEPQFIRKRIPSTEDLESRFQALEIQKSLKSPTTVTSNLLSPSKTKTDFSISTPELDTGSKRKSDIPSTEDLENRFQALEQSKLTQIPSKRVQNEKEEPITKSENAIPSTKDLETRFEALEQRKLIVDSTSKTKGNETEINCDLKKDHESKTLPTTLDLEVRFQELEQKKSISTKSKKKSISNENATSDLTIIKEGSIKNEQECKKLPSTEDLETRYQALEQQKSIAENCTKFKDNQSNSTSKTSVDYSERKEKEDKELPSTEDLETRFEALEQQKAIKAGCSKLEENHTISELKTSNDDISEPKEQETKIFSSPNDFEAKLETLKDEKLIMGDCSKANILGSLKPKDMSEVKDMSTQDLETRFDALKQQKSMANDSGTKTQESVSDSQIRFSAIPSGEKEKLTKEIEKKSAVPSTQDLETRFEALEQQKSTTCDSSTPKGTKTSDTPSYVSKRNNLEYTNISKVPSTHDLEKRFDDMQIDMKKIEQKDFKIDKKQENPPEITLIPDNVQDIDHLAENSSELVDHPKRKDLYKLESQSDETLTATDQTSTEFDAKTESRPTSCPEYTDPFDSNIVTTDRVLKIIEENSKILHRILKKTLADAGDVETNTQSKKAHSGITDSLLALGNIFPRNDETISPSRIKSHSWIRPSITLRSEDNISDRLASIKSTIKSIDTLCEEKSFRKEKCQRYIDSLFARPTITTTTPANPSIKVDDFESKAPSQDRVPKRELKKDISPRRRRDEDREEYESRVRRDMMPNSLDTPSDLSFSLANIEQVDSEVDRINQEKQVDTQMERPLSPYYVSGYDLNKRSITPVVYIPTKLEIRHTTVTSTFYDRYLTEKHIERTFPRSKKSPVSPTITKSYLDISNYSSMNSNDRSSKSAENSPSRRKDGIALSTNEIVSSATNKRSLISTLDVATKDLHIRSCDNILLQLRSSTNNKDIIPSIMVYNPLPTKIRKPPELGISLGLYKDYGSDESSKS